MHVSFQKAVHAEKGMAIDAERRRRSPGWGSECRSIGRLFERVGSGGCEGFRVRRLARRRPGRRRRGPRRLAQDTQSAGVLPRLAVPSPLEGHRRGVHQIAARREHAQEEQVIK